MTESYNIPSIFRKWPMAVKDQSAFASCVTQADILGPVRDCIFTRANEWYHLSVSLIDCNLYEWYCTPGTRHYYIRALCVTKT